MWWCYLLSYRGKDWPITQPRVSLRRHMWYVKVVRNCVKCGKRYDFVHIILDRIPASIYSTSLDKQYFVNNFIPGILVHPLFYVLTSRITKRIAWWNENAYVLYRYFLWIQRELAILCPPGVSLRAYVRTWWWFSSYCGVFHNTYQICITCHIVYETSGVTLLIGLDLLGSFRTHQVSL